jgi:hypothetical protein
MVKYTIKFVPLSRINHRGRVGIHGIDEEKAAGRAD